ncbi:hypothetical protein [Chryseobacterium arachidis]|uniref:hypothetical protein n=1 Tax=Chryseobacterium arachidis TaxID=1416778 RepID=UPI000932317C|nr:hypothetical protein [Chryseobacterium arachidis]
MNGIIFHGKSATVGCSAEFIFEPEITTEPVQAIAEFSTGEKAYAEILKVDPCQVQVRLGEYVNGKGKIVRKTVCRLFYDQSNKSWQIRKNLL